MTSLKTHKKPILAAAWISENFITASLDQTVKIWTLEEGPKGLKIKLTTEITDLGEITSLTVHPSHLYFCVAGTDGTFSLLSTTGEKVCASVQTDESINVVGFHPDGAILATGSVAGNVRMWDVKTRTQATLFEQGGAVVSLSFSENGYHFATARFG